MRSRIVAEIERRFSVIDELEATVAANLQRAARLRQSILDRAFRGELVRGAETTGGDGRLMAVDDRVLAE